MAERLSAGIFIEERSAGAAVVQAVSTSNFAIAGFTKRGVANKALLVTSMEDFFTQFGGFTLKSLLPTQVAAFFNNGGARGYVTRVTPLDAVVATGDIVTNWRFNAIGPGADYNRYRVVIAGDENTKTIATATYTLFTVQVQVETEDGEGDFASVETFERISLTDVNSKDYIVERLKKSTIVALVMLTGGIPTSFASTAVTGESVGTGDGATQTFTDTLSQTPVAENTLKIKLDGTLVGIDNGTGRIDAVSGSGVSGTIDYEDGALSVFFSTPPGNTLLITADYYKAGAASEVADLAGGADGTFPLTRAVLTNPQLEVEGNLKGIYAFNEVDEFLNMGLSEAAGDLTMTGDLISYAERRKDVFVIVAPPEGLSPQEVLNYKRVTLASQSNYAAMYYPWITLEDPNREGVSQNIPPLGHIVGVYARTDNAKNVGKAPAGVEDGPINFALGLERTLSKGARDLIYPANINPLISTPQTGRVVWGSRTLAITGDFTQVGVRRLFIFLEKSVFNSTHDFVFETIGTSLFGKITARIVGFLNTLFLQQYFKGDTPDQAYFVVCNESNNPASVQASRTVFCDIGVAAQEPGEFIVFRFQRKLDDPT